MSAAFSVFKLFPLTSKHGKDSRPRSVWYDSVLNYNVETLEENICCYYCYYGLIFSIFINDLCDAVAHSEHYFLLAISKSDRLCGLVVRVLGYRSGGSGSIPGTTRKK
jgi:hypothetical protein